MTDIVDEQNGTIDTLFNQLEDKEFTNVTNPQYYNPLYEKLFEITPENSKIIQLNHKFRVKSLLAKDNDSIFNGIIVNHKNNESKTVPIFFKYSPLLDPVKYMIGKYKDEQVVLPTYGLNSDEKIYQCNNSAYTDGFFYFLSSLLLNQYHFVNAIDFYGSFIGIKKDFKVNIEEELSLIHQSEYYHLHKNKKIKILGNVEDYMFMDNESRKYKDKLTIQPNTSLKSNLSIHSVENDINELFVTNDLSTDNDFNSESSLTDINLSIHNEENITLNKNTSTSNSYSSSACSSRSSVTNGADTCDSDDDDNHSNHTDSDMDSDSDDDNERDSENDLHAQLESFPVNMIALEKCDITFDKYITKNDISNAEMCAGLMQVIMTLITYQKCFKLTHNDLHTNNIMLCATEKQNIIYKFDSKHYKVPTFGYIYKIIDFGRSIYTFKGITYYSDSFSSEGDATTQYNSEPFYNKDKTKVEPNFSFDLCRLACSMFDLIIDDDKDIDELDDPVSKLIVDWCKDDKGRNVLYKSNTEERYPGFKLYKMIARTVHNHIPSKQLDRDIFSGYRVAKSKLNKKTRIINIDAMNEM